MMPSRSHSLDNFQATNLTFYLQNQTRTCTFTQNLPGQTRTAPVLPCTMAQPSRTSAFRRNPLPFSASSAIPVKEHIDHHMHIGNVPPLIDWTFVEFRSVRDKVLRYLHEAVGQENLETSRIRIWYRDTIGFVIVGITLKNNISRDWMILDERIETIVRDTLREVNAGFGLIRVAVTYQLLPPVPLPNPAT